MKDLTAPFNNKIFSAILLRNYFIIHLWFILLLSIPDFVSGKSCVKNQDNDSTSFNKTDSLFSSGDPIDITLLLDHKKITREKTNDPSYSSARLTYHSMDGKKDSFDIMVKSRGYARRLYPYCSFPPLMLNFKKGSVNHTIFENQDKLKLVTYCSNTELNENYIIEEYLIYKIFNLLTDYSYRVRLAHITYQDINNKITPITRYGFIIESSEKLAERTGGKVSKEQLPDQDRCDRPSIDRFTIFQYMIGNTDWWVLNFHNVTLLQVPGKRLIPVPYDFDYAGVINASYAAPGENLPIQSVKERLFRGYCRIPGSYEKTIDIFKEKKDMIYGLYLKNNLVDKRRMETTLHYYDDFYDIINDPKQIIRKLYDACEIKHEHIHQIK